MDPVSILEGYEDVPDDILASFITEVLAEGNSSSSTLLPADATTSSLTTNANATNFKKEIELLDTPVQPQAEDGDNDDDGEEEEAEADMEAEDFLPIFRSTRVRTHTNVNIAMPTTAPTVFEAMGETAVDLLGSDTHFAQDVAKEQQQLQQLQQQQQQQPPQDTGNMSLDPFAIALRAAAAVDEFFDDQEAPPRAPSTPTTSLLQKQGPKSTNTARTKYQKSTSFRKNKSTSRGSLKSPPLRILSSKHKKMTTPVLDKKRTTASKTTTTPKAMGGARVRQPKQRVQTQRQIQRQRRQQKQRHQRHHQRQKEQRDTNNSSMFVERDISEEYEDIDGEERDDYYEMEEEEEQLVEEEEGEERMDEQRRLYQMRLEQQLEMELERQQYMMHELERSLEEERNPSSFSNMMMDSPSSSFHRQSMKQQQQQQEQQQQQQQEQQQQQQQQQHVMSSPYERTSPPTPPRSRTSFITRTPTHHQHSYPASSQDSDTWREVMQEQQRRCDSRPRTAPPQGLDRESGMVWSTTKSYVMNQSYMVGEAPARPQRSGMTVSR
jgi:hypothetical protein